MAPGSKSYKAVQQGVLGAATVGAGGGRASDSIRLGSEGAEIIGLLPPISYELLLRLSESYFGLEMNERSGLSRLEASVNLNPNQ